MTELATKIRNQIEFYFGDVNVSRDQFLRQKMSESADGTVPVSVLLTFKRLRTLVGETLTDEEATTKILDALDSSDVVIASKEAKGIRRAHPLPESVVIDPATAYAKPIDVKYGLDELKELFSKYGTVRAVWRRGDAKEGPKPSVFICFSSEEEVAKFCAAGPELDGEKLTAIPKLDYLAAKGKAKQADKGAGNGAKKLEFKSPPMPENASVSVTECGEIDNFKSVKGIWPMEDHGSIRYVVISEDKLTTFLIFQDKETCDRLLAAAEANTDKKVNDKTPKLTRLEGAEDAKIRQTAEDEIANRAAANRNNGGGRGRGGGGRGGRGRGGRGGGGGRGGRGGGKRSRD